MKKNLLILCLIFSLLWSFIPLVSAEDTCGSQSGFSQYTCRVDKICQWYESEKPTYNTEDYEDAEGAQSEFHGQKSTAPALNTAKKLYRENMGNIYKCAMIQAQKNSLTFIKKQISTEKSGKLEDTVWWQIDVRINRLELSANKIGCALTDKKQVNNKLNVLRETSYEACRYTSYLEYLKGFYRNTDNQLETTAEVETTLVNGQLPQMIEWVQDEIAQEIAHTYKVFPIAFQAYAEYENNFPVHFLLEIIKGDFLLLRQWLYETLMPIAQLGLKVINAMSY